MNKIKGLLKFFLAIIWLPLLIWIFRGTILKFIQNHEILNVIYQFCSSEIQAKTYFGAAILIFIGDLFFIMFLPAYAVFIYFSTTAHLNPIILIAFSAGAKFCSMIVNYGFGLLIGRLLPKKYTERFETLLNNRWSSVFVFGVYLIPVLFPHGLAALVAGSTKFRFQLFVLLSIIGCILNFTILHIIQDIMVPYVKFFTFS